MDEHPIIVCVDIKRFNQRIKFLLKLLLDFNSDKAYMWFCETIERNNIKLEVGADQIPFDVIYFSYVNYIIALYENVFTLVAQKESLVFKKKKVYPNDILDAVKKNAKNNEIMQSLDELKALCEKRHKLINNYFKHNGMPYTTMDGTYVSFYYQLNNMNIFESFDLTEVKDEAAQFYKGMIKIVNRILEYYKLELLNTELSGTTIAETNQLLY